MGCLLEGTPSALAKMSKVRDFPTFLSERGEWSMAMEQVNQEEKYLKLIKKDYLLSSNHTHGLW